MIFFLFSYALARSCKVVVNAIYDHPTKVSYRVDEGERICINTTNPYLTVVFHNSVLSVRYFSKETTSPLSHELGNFLFPAEKGIIALNKKIGSVEITALVPGEISFSYFNFPQYCDKRYITTRAAEELDIKHSFGPYDSGYLCVWYPEKEYSLQTEVPATAPNKLEICKSAANCEAPIARNQQFTVIESNQFIRINFQEEEFWDDLHLTFAASSPSNYFQMSGAVAEEPGAFPVNIEKLDDVKPLDHHDDDDEEDEDLKRRIKNIDEDDDDKHHHKGDDHKKDQKEDHKHSKAELKKIAKKKRKARYNTFLKVLGIFIAIYIIGGIFILAFDIKITRKNRRFDDHSEERLLQDDQREDDNYPKMPFSMQQPGFPRSDPQVIVQQQQEAPVQGAYFPSVQQEQEPAAQQDNEQPVNNQF
ncbi:hypothetical protein TRFO_13879 [Tritrichomonas foetus]|uniref:Uncharacterized protein n=1 Tax=Tritrichomonas foetus TaxID=1144522 RepID=A0A1J4KWT8_9EUKA|nr:hypothetical protein TRFO_13879 [Tritrichomonas foetus]|eukprot:OHT15715.1 hypothetical protein TRFO_13879 [Tritrichomonas foetus]